MALTPAGPPRGVISGPVHGGGRHHRWLPAPELRAYVEHYWHVSWNLEGRPRALAQTLPHPSVHLIFERGRSRLSGVHEGPFRRWLQGRGQVFGIKFAPGGFGAFWRGPVRSLSNRTVSPSRLLGAQVREAQALFLSDTDDETKVAAADALLLGLNPHRDLDGERASRAVRLILETPSIVRVEQLATALRCSVREVQRLFVAKVGVSPKWVIQRYRLHEACERLKAGDAPLSELALELGFFDQAHFSRAFKAMVGLSPQAFQRRAALTRPTAGQSATPRPRSPPPRSR